MDAEERHGDGAIEAGAEDANGGNELLPEEAVERPDPLAAVVVRQLGDEERLEGPARGPRHRVNAEAVVSVVGLLGPAQQRHAPG